MPEISIIIPTLDPDIEFGWEHKLEETTVDAELLVRTDGSASEARNAGIRAANADKLVFLDDDSVPKGEYFDRVAALLDDHPAVTGRIRDTGAPLLRGLSSQYDQGDEGHVTDTVVGCNMAIRREVFEDVGTFDERLPYGHEEAELTNRICNSYDFWYCPDLVVEHPFAESIPDYFEKQYRHGKEAISYYDIQGYDIHRQMARFALLPSRYLESTLPRTLIGASGQIVGVAGLLHGYAEYRFGADG